MDPFAELDKAGAAFKEVVARFLADHEGEAVPDFAEQTAKMTAQIEGLQAKFGALIAQTEKPGSATAAFLKQVDALRTTGPLPPLDAALAAETDQETFARFRREHLPEPPQRAALVRSLLQDMAVRPAAEPNTLEREAWQDWGDDM